MLIYFQGQGLSHGLLRRVLERYARTDPHYVPNESIIFFEFHAENDGLNGDAAQVVVLRDNPVDGVDEVLSQEGTPQARKRGEGEILQLNQTRRALTHAELKARLKAGEGTRFV